MWKQIGEENCWEVAQAILPPPIGLLEEYPTAAEINFEIFEDRLCGMGATKALSKNNLCTGLAAAKEELAEAIKEGDDFSVKRAKEELEVANAGGQVRRPIGSGRRSSKAAKLELA